MQNEKTNERDGASRKTQLGRWLNKNVFSKAGVNLVSNGSWSSASAVSRWPYRMLYFERLLTIAHDVEGDLVECGVGSGQTLLIFTILLRDTEHQRHIWGFDSFEGLPDPTSEDLQSRTNKARKGMIRVGEARVWDALTEGTGFDSKDVESLITLKRGWFSDTLPHYEGKIALLHLDADLYESTKDALENLWPKISTGGVIALDEYLDEDWPGAKQAVDEYLGAHFSDGRAELVHDAHYPRAYIIKHE
jgi:hypothetical protein